MAPPPPPSVVLAGRVAVDERQVLYRQPRAVLVLTVRRSEALGLVAGVLVQDAALPTAAQRDQSAPVEHHLGAGVAHLRGGGHGDRDRGGATGEGDHTTGRHGGDHRRRCAAGRGTSADDPGRVAAVDRLPVRRYRRVPVGVPGQLGVDWCCGRRCRRGCRPGARRGLRRPGRAGGLVGCRPRGAAAGPDQQRQAAAGGEQADSHRSTLGRPGRPGNRGGGTSAAVHTIAAP